MPSSHPLVIDSSGARLAAVLHLPDGSGPFPFLVVAHGLGSSKDSDKYVLIAEAFSQAGVAACRFDFRGCGGSSGAFAETTVTGEIEDLRAVVGAMRARADCDGRIALLGSSMGGFVSLFAAQHDLDIRAVATWGSPAGLDDLLTEPEVARSYGLGTACLEEFEAEAYRRAPAGTPRCLVVHGDCDEVVPVSHARQLFAAAVEPRALEILPGADHRLADAAHRSRALETSLAWVTRCLNERPQ